MELTGHPFIDAGMAIAAHLAQRQSVESLSSADLQSAVAVLEERLDGLNRLKVLAAYWQNNPLAGKNLSQLASYRGKLHSLSNANVAVKPGHCHTCGRGGVFADANRSWFPLAASAESDPCTLPNLRGKFLCADCFRALIVLPLGCKFCKGGPYLFHLSDPTLQVEAGAEGAAAVNSQLAAHASGNAGLKERTRLSGRLELLEITSGSRVWDTTQNADGVLSHPPARGATVVSFSNSGTSASFAQLHLPAQALYFFAALWEAGKRSIFLEWAEKSKSTFYDRICDDVEARRSIAPILAALVRGRKDGERTLSRDERLVMQIYEDIALEKKERFDVLERVAGRINEMDRRYRDSFVKQLGNTRSKDRFLQLLREFAQPEKTRLRLSPAELRVIDAAPPAEAISLLYLLCVAES